MHQIGTRSTATCTLWTSINQADTRRSRSGGKRIIALDSRTLGNPPPITNLVFCFTTLPFSSDSHLKTHFARIMFAPLPATALLKSPNVGAPHSPPTSHRAKPSVWECIYAIVSSEHEERSDNSLAGQVGGAGVGCWPRVTCRGPGRLSPRVSAQQHRLSTPRLQEIVAIRPGIKR